MAQTQTKANVKFRPVGNRALVQRLDPEEVAAGGIILPESAKKKQETAVVIAVGVGETDKEGILHTVPVQVGDKVLIDKYAGQEVSLNDKEYVVVKGDDIIAIVQE